MKARLWRVFRGTSRTVTFRERLYLSKTTAEAGTYARLRQAGAPWSGAPETEYPATIVVRPRTRRCIHICSGLLLPEKEVIGQAARLISTS